MNVNSPVSSSESSSASSVSSSRFVCPTLSSDSSLNRAQNRSFRNTDWSDNFVRSKLLFNDSSLLEISGETFESSVLRIFESDSFLKSSESTLNGENFLDFELFSDNLSVSWSSMLDGDVNNFIVDSNNNNNDPINSCQMKSDFSRNLTAEKTNSKCFNFVTALTLEQFEQRRKITLLTFLFLSFCAFFLSLFLSLSFSLYSSITSLQ